MANDLPSELTAPPGDRERWHALRRQVVSMESGAADEVVRRLESRLAGWDDALRELPSTSSLLNDPPGGHPFCRLARVVRFRRHRSGAASVLQSVCENDRLASVRRLIFVDSDVDSGWSRLAGLERLEHLTLHKMTLLGDEIRAIAVALRSCPIQRLQISRCGLRSASAAPLIEALHSLDSLKELDLSGNGLGTQAVLEILGAAKPGWQLLKVDGNRVADPTVVRRAAPDSLRLDI